MNKCEILGVKINVTNMKETVNCIEKNLNEFKGDYICISNVHTTVMSYENEEYRNIQNSGVMALPDGAPLSFISRKRGFKEATRVTGPDLMGEIFKISEKKGYKHYFYGSSEDTLNKLKTKLNKKYPHLKIVGMYSPPFKKNVEIENEDKVKEINNLEPDFIWVGLGAPKQEIWMYKHRNILKGLMIGVGAGFDYYADKIQRAPTWMQNNNLEWLYRLLQDPKRLMKRYVITNSKFIVNIIKENKKNV